MWIEKIVFLGDLVSPGGAKIFAGCGIPVEAIWWNNEGDKHMISEIAFKYDNYEIHNNTYANIKLGDKKVFITHYPTIAKSMAKSGDFDAVFYGHNHDKNKEMIWNCLLLNPGEVWATKKGEGSFAIYDTDTNEADIILIEDNKTLKTELVDNYRAEIGFEYSATKAHKL